MSGPIVFISHNRVKDGLLAEYRQFYQEGAGLIEASKPGTLVFLAYFSEEDSQVTIIHIFPDADAMAMHMQGASARAKQAYVYLEPVALDVYGNPGDQILQAMKQATGPGVSIKLNPDGLGGFVRLLPGR